MPVIGLHSVMLKPDSVNRVTPPTPMTPRTKTEESMSHLLTDGGGRTGSSSFVGRDGVQMGRLEGGLGRTSGAFIVMPRKAEKRRSEFSLQHRL